MSPREAAMSELEIWNELGNIYFNTGAYDEAIRTYQKAIELDHGCGQSYSNLASIYVRQGRYAEAIPMLQKGIEIMDEASSKAFLWNQLGEAYRKLDDYDNATISYQKAAELDPDNTAFQDNLAEAEMASRRVDSQFIIGTEQEKFPIPESLVEEINSPIIKETSRTGAALSRTKQKDETDTVQEKLSILPDITESPKSETACWVFKANSPSSLVQENSSGTPEPSPVILGSRILSDGPIQDGSVETPGSLEELNTPDQDITDRHTLDLADEILPTGQPEGSESTNARAHGLLRLGILHWRKKEYERAIQFLEIALDTVVRPKDNFLEALCFNVIALVETDLGKIADAIQAYQSAATLAPERFFPWNNLGNLNCMLDRYDDALAAFREGIEHNSKDAVSWNGLGDVYHKLGRNEDAIAAYQLGNVFEKQNLDEDALKAYEITIETNRENPQVWNEAGNIYYDTGAYDDAIASYRKAIELDPANTTFLSNLAKAEQALGQANTKNEPPSPETMREISRENLPQSEPYVEKTASPEPEGTNMALSVSIGAEQTHEDETVPEELSTLKDGIADSEPETAYWVFKTEPSLGNGLQPAARYSKVGAETVVGAVKSFRAYTKQPHNEQAFSKGQVLTGADIDASALMVQLTPRAVQPTGAEGKIRPSIAKNDWKCASSEVDSEVRKTSSCTTEVGINNPAPQAVVTGSQIADQSPIDFHVLENDIAAYRRVTEINPRNDRAWDALGNMYEAAGLHSEAIAAFEQAIALDPRKEAYHYHLGIAHAYQMHYDKAIQALQNVIALNPNYVLAHCALAASYRRVGNEAEAQEHIAIARPSMEYENEYNRACFESISGNTDQAFALLEIALEKQQIQTAMLHSDPDLDFIRSDPRFDALLAKIMNVNR
jgi:tetratricopeptide (TPR) repeat protein